MDADLLSAIDNEILPSHTRGRRKTMLSRWVTTCMRFACAVRLGVMLLSLLVLACFLGMLIMQQTTDGFENYYAALTPAQRTIFGGLGLFNIYHAWYFNALLGLLSANIVLASVDRFPKSWLFVSRPQVTPPIRWLSGQPCNESIEFDGPAKLVSDEIRRRLIAGGWMRTRIAEKNGITYIFADSGVWNRLGAYPVHIALLTIFFGGFLTATLGTTGEMTLAPGESSDLIRQNAVDLDRITEVKLKLPFSISVTDIEQKLIRGDGPLAAGNTLDWITRFTITDEGKTYEGVAQMNRPLDYRGYRFFQSSFTPVGRARNIFLAITDTTNAEVRNITLYRDASATLPDGTRIAFDEFRGNFRIGPEDPNEDTSAYPNPAAVLSIETPNGTKETAYAFRPEMAGVPAATKAVGGYTFKLLGFEKVSDRHVLSVQRDPGSSVVYVGFAGLFLALTGVFLFSHQRVWVALSEQPNGRCPAIVAGNTNRNLNSFEVKFARFVTELRSARSTSKRI